LETFEINCNIYALMKLLGKISLAMIRMKFVGEDKKVN